MNKKIIGLAVALPFAAVGTLGFMGEAKAVQLGNGIFVDQDRINVFTQACLALDTDLSPSGQPPLIYFAPPAPGSGVFDCGLQGAPMSPPGPPAADIGDLGELGVGSGGNGPGTFAFCNAGIVISTTCVDGKIRSFVGDVGDDDDNINGDILTNTPDFFIRVDRTDGLYYLFTLDTTTLEPPGFTPEIINPFANCGPGGTLILGCEVSIDLIAQGSVGIFDANGNILDAAHVTYNYTQQGFVVDRFENIGGVVRAITTPISGSSNITATIKVVDAPESSTVNALLALGAFGFMASAVKKMRK